jgi:uncharacterized membrane protein
MDGSPRCTVVSVYPTERRISGMARTIEALLRDQGRGVVGALVVSVGLLFTMEMWWHGWQLPAEWLIVYALVGLAVVLAITRSVGFEAQEEQRQSR